ncbi:TVP38/TMEM64 family protein [Agaribacterium sp. ZY112]|uniref:TVP38/TMEM64 family protein n=1 Tax=Agaribacterium sp. ZY112 TaxID=3233574 RepID=UPI0035263430
MKALIKLILVLALGFAFTFLALKLSGTLSVETIKHWLEDAQSVNSWYLAGMISFLLFADLFVAIPTLTVIMLGGFFIGHLLGALASIVGLMAAGSAGYMISYHFGEHLEKLVIRDPKQRKEMRKQFHKYGIFMILFSRAMPILPEVSACLAGITRMSFGKFLLAWSVCTIPYCIIAAYAGSISTLDDPKPALLTAAGLSVFFWTAWYIIRKRKV